MNTDLKHIIGPVLAVLCLAGTSPAAVAADFSDPTWPCIQRKVETLSAGLMWPHPLDPPELSPDTRAAVEALVDRLVLRRVAVEDLTPNVETFVAVHGRDTALLGHVFAEAFDSLAGTRKRLIRGIGDYSLKQIDLSEKIDAGRATMTSLMAADQPDFDRIDALEEQLDWDERIFTDRAQSLTYVCESPVLIEKRLYAIAQMLLAQIGS